MEYVQLIEKVLVPGGVWMTFWSIQDHARLSLEVRSPVRRYKIGEVFILHRNARREREVLGDVLDAEALRHLDFPVPLPSKVKRAMASWKNRLTIIGPQKQEAGGSLVVFSDVEDHRLVS